jgi:hypothetical protein
MKEKDPDAFLDDIKAANDAERDTDYSVTPEEGKRLLKQYENEVTPDAFKKITPEEFFDGS